MRTTLMNAVSIIKDWRIEERGRRKNEDIFGADRVSIPGPIQMFLAHYLSLGRPLTLQYFSRCV